MLVVMHVSDSWNVLYKNIEKAVIASSEWC